MIHFRTGISGWNIPLWGTVSKVIACAALFILPGACAFAQAPGGVCPVVQISATEYDGPSSSMDWVARAALDKDGNLIIGGHHVDGFTSWLVRKYDSNLGLIWSKTVNGTYEMYGISTDPAGNIVAIGTYGGNWCVVKMDSEGNQKWYKILGTAGADYGGAVAADANFVYAVGSMNTEITIKILNTSDGSQHEQAQPGMSGNLWGATVSAVTGELIAVGEVNRDAIEEGMNGIVLAYDSSGTQSWTWEYAGETGGTTWQGAFGVDVDSKGNVFVTGGAGGIGWLQKLSSGGTPIWTVTDAGSDYADAIVNWQDNVALVGNTTPVKNLLVRQYDNEGNYQCELTADIYGLEDTLRGAVFAGDGSLLAGGHVRTASAGNNWYIVKYAGDPPPYVPVAPSGLREAASVGTLYVYPHPLKCPGGYAVFEMPQAGTATLRVMSMRGEMVKEKVAVLPTMAKAQVYIACEEVKRGAYILEVTLHFGDGTTQILEPYKFVVAGSR